MKRALAILALTLAACRTPEPAELQTIRADGFTVQHDGCLTSKDAQVLIAELTASKKTVLELLGKWAAPGDFRARDERTAACPADRDPRVLVISGTGRCHADEAGITVLKAHLERKDATHELVHWLAGGS